MPPLEDMVRLYEFGFVPNQKIRDSNKKRKRRLDQALALIGLLAATPVMIIAALAVKLDSKGPIFYKSRRVGEGGKVFSAYKLRTMYDGNRNSPNEAHDVSQCNFLDDVLVVQNPDDPRITRVGKILRRFSIDELPQFVNVLRGDISVVGIRPFGYEEAQRFVDYARHIGNQRYLGIFYCPGGMTSLAAIHGRGDLPKVQRIEYDLEYTRKFNTEDILRCDLQIIGRTLKFVINGKGAY